MAVVIGRVRAKNLSVVKSTGHWIGTNQSIDMCEVPGQSSNI